MSVLVICVDYRCSSDAMRLARTILDDTSASPVRVLIVDNNDTPSFYPELDGRVSVHRAGGNLGYFGGACAGLEEWLKGQALPDWVLVANCDLRFETGFFGLLAGLSSPNDTGVLAPSIRSGVDRRDQNPYMKTRPSRIRTWKWRLLYSHPLLYRLYDRWRRRVPRREAAPAPHAQIYAPHGSCVVLSRRYFERGGTLRHPGFLYMEELFVAETARRLGLRVLYCPELRVEHKEHEITESLQARQIVRWHRESLRGLMPMLSQR